MIAELGYATIFITLLLDLFGIFAVSWGMIKKREAWIESARSILTLIMPLLTLVLIYFGILIVDHHYEVQYVYQISNNTMPLYLQIAAIWAGQSGSLLFWTWTLALVGFIFMFRNWDMDRVFMPWVILVYLFILSFFLLLIMFYQNPFLRFWQLWNGEQVIALLRPASSLLLKPSDGLGGNPLLHHPGMIFHPPLLYFGYSALLVPFAFGFAALIIKRVDDRWIRVVRPWVIMGWIFMLAGIIIGTRWTYVVMGWGTHWTWDAVESTALMPWILTTAFLHSIMIQEKSRMYMRWNMILVILDFLIVLFGIFLTRTGILSSSHQYIESSIKLPFYLFMLLMFSGCLYLIIVRWGYLKSDGLIYTYFSRESFFIVNNLLFFSLFAIIFTGITYPILTKVIGDGQIIIGEVWFTTMTKPIMIAIYLMMSIAPLTSWGYSTWKTISKELLIPLSISMGGVILLVLISDISFFSSLGFGMIMLCLSVIVYDFIGSLRFQRISAELTKYQRFVWMIKQNQKRYGAYLIHFGLSLITMSAVATNAYLLETQQTLHPDESYPVSSYDVKFVNLDRSEAMSGKETISAVLQLYENGEFIREINPKREYYKQINYAVSMPGIYSNLKEDIYVVIADWEPIFDDQVTFKIFRNVLISWMWVGGILMIFGAFMSIYPRRKYF
jgi:cytochrome c-type biogenesis protein CcmF